MIRQTFCARTKTLVTSDGIEVELHREGLAIHKCLHKTQRIFDIGDGKNNVIEFHATWKLM